MLWHVLATGRGMGTLLFKTGGLGESELPGRPLVVLQESGGPALKAAVMWEFPLKSTVPNL